MANIKSSKKAIKVIAKKTKANHDYIARVKNSVKAVEKTIKGGDKKVANETFKTLQKDIDKALQKGLVTGNKANREKKRLNSKIKEMK